MNKFKGIFADLATSFDKDGVKTKAAFVRKIIVK